MEDNVAGACDRPSPSHETPRRRRKRKRVPTEQRQRAVVACSSCRRLKEKCDGSVPCERCRRHGRHCEMISQESRPPAPGSAPKRVVTPMPDDRTKYLESVARHFLGDVSLDAHNLSRIVHGLENGQDEAERASQTHEADALELNAEPYTVESLSKNTTYYSGELSHWNFANRIKKQVDERLLDAPASDSREHFRVLDFWRPEHLKSRYNSVTRILESLPPKQVALFLVRIYFQYAQTNVFFVDEAWVLAKVEYLYSQHVELSADDAPWLCSTILVFAIATQFAHMKTDSNGKDTSSTREECDEDAAAESAGVAFYQMAADLNPDVIAIASIESVQACLMLAHYVMPLDTQGLAYTYLGLALRMAIQNGMHRHHGQTQSDGLFRMRLWWTAYALEKRVSILHGRPSSIPASEIDVEYPPESPVKLTDDCSSRLENTMLRITDWLGDIAFVVHMLRKSPRNLLLTYFERLLQVRQQYKQWWDSLSLPSHLIAMSRAVSHIHMTHHLNLVFLGRPFITFVQHEPSVSASHLSQTGTRNPQIESLRLRRQELVADALASAKEIVAVCQTLRSSVGLARASYIEFTSCRAAVMMLLAQSLHDTSDELHLRVMDGMSLIREMASANLSTRSDASVLGAIEAGIEQIHLRNAASTSAQHRAGGTLPKSALEADRGTGFASVQPDLEMQQAFGDFGWIPFDENDPFAIDGMGNLFNFEDSDTFHFDEAFSIATGSLLNNDAASGQRSDPSHG